MNEPKLVTAGDWKEFLRNIPDDTAILFDTHPLNGGSFESAKLAPYEDCSEGPISLVLTWHGQ